jgi:hypothetical protein
MGPPSLPFSTHCSKPSSRTKKSQSRNSRPLRSLPQSPLSRPLPPKLLSFTEDPPPPYSPPSNPPSYGHISSSTSPLSSPPITRWTTTLTSSPPRPAQRTPATTPTNTPSLSRTVKTFGLHKRSSSTETSYVSSPIAKTSQRPSPISSPLFGLKSFIWSLYRRQAHFPPSSCALK